MNILSKYMKSCIRDEKDLQTWLQLSDRETEDIKQIIQRYPLCITPYYLSLIDPRDPNDPIRKMSIPSALERSQDGQADTSGEADNTVIKGMQHKYAQTALILSTNQCIMYCRHCFRKRMVGSSANEIANELPAMAEYVRTHKEINNVLISGGDAFVNENEVIEKYLETFSEIPSLDYIRFGTRTPVVLPQRIIEDDALLTLLAHYNEKKRIIIVTQFNHPREITAAAQQAIRMLQDCGCIIRNQTVLLKGVNDNPAILGEMMNALVKIGVVPYYIFQCRPVIGVKNHFQVPLLEGLRIVDTARTVMSGQAKSVRYAMSHPTGKIEIIGQDSQGDMIFKYHQSKNDTDASRIFTMKLEDSQCWLGDIIS